MATDVDYFNSAVVSSLSVKKIDALKALGVDPTSACFANSIYGGRNILDCFTERELYNKFNNEDYSGLYIGDYITKTITYSEKEYTWNWLFAHFSPVTGSATNRGVILIPDIYDASISTIKSPLLGASDENYSSGYCFTNSNIYKILPDLESALTASTAFGSFALNGLHASYSSGVSNDLLSSGIGLAGRTTSAQDIYKKCNILNEMQITGSARFSSSAYDNSGISHRFALFELMEKAGKPIKQTFWTSSLAYKQYYCLYFPAMNGIYPNWCVSSYGVIPYVFYRGTPF